MNRRVLLAMALVATLGLSVRAEEKVPETPQELKLVQVINGASFTSDRDLNAEYKLVANGLGFNKATFQRDGGTLRIGVELADVEKGEILRIKQNSDCPDNSQFHVDGDSVVIEKREQAIKDTLFAWTKHRHDDFSAKLRVINISALADGKRNFDVQLDLSRVSFLPRE